MRAGLRFRRIVFPQIVQSSLPGLINEMSLLIKVTPVLAVVGVVDITRAAVRIGAETYEPLPPFFVAIAIYVPIVFALVSIQRWVERRRAAPGGAHDPRLRRRLGRARPDAERPRQHRRCCRCCRRVCALVLGALLAMLLMRRGKAPALRRARLRRRHALHAVPAVRLHRLLRPAFARHPLRQLERRAWSR